VNGQLVNLGILRTRFVRLFTPLANAAGKVVLLAPFEHAHAVN
jgi:hypothetical protein